MFDEQELKELKITIRNLNEGKIQSKQLKQKLLQCRGRIVKDVSNFLTFYVDYVRENNQNQDSRNQTSPNQPLLVNNHLQQEILEREELLEAVAKTMSNFVLKLKESNKIV